MIYKIKFLQRNNFRKTFSHLEVKPITKMWLKVQINGCLLLCLTKYCLMKLCPVVECLTTVFKGRGFKSWLCRDWTSFLTQFTQCNGNKNGLIYSARKQSLRAANISSKNLFYNWFKINRFEPMCCFND